MAMPVRTCWRIFGGVMRIDAPEKPWVSRAFSRAAASYDAVAALQRQVGEAALARLAAVAAAPARLLDVGAGTGYCTARLADQFPAADLIALDIAEGMLRQLRVRPLAAHCVCADAEALPLRSACVDAVLSNLAVQWCYDLPAVLRECRRVTRPGGVVIFSTFGAGTLAELRQAWAAADGYTHVNAFLSAAAVTAALDSAGFAAHSVTVERRVLAYASVEALLRELKALGAHNVNHGRPRHLTGKAAFRRMLAAYPADASGRIVASFEVIYGMARLCEAD